MVWFLIKADYSLVKRRIYAMLTEFAEKINHPLLPFKPAAPAEDRAAWEGLDADIKTRLLAGGEEALKTPFPSLTATDYLAFTRTGNRTGYEDKMFARRTMLGDLVLAECVQNEGRFLDHIIDGIFDICGEAGWQLPAHNSYIRDTPQLPLPDVTRPVVDLFAAETAAVLATADYCLGAALDRVSPAIRVMIRDNVNRRVLKPYLSEHFWWMGDGESHMNNWTVWCTQNVLLAAFLLGRDEKEGGPGGTANGHGDLAGGTAATASGPELLPLPLSVLLRKACRSIDYFLDEYGEDGCCDEGAQYYRHAGLCLFGCLDLLNSVTGGAFLDCFRDSKIYNIAAYILNVHVAGPYYVNFSDCSPVAGRCGAREYLFGKCTGNHDLMAFAAADYAACPRPDMPWEHNLFYRLQSLFVRGEILAFAAGRGDAPVPHPDIYYPSAGLFIARDDRFCLAVKAGDNDDSHNHNDTGSFTVYKDGRPFFIDLGVESYTQKTFSPQRYEIWTMQSAYHNLPSFGGLMQKDGPRYRARQVECLLDENLASLSMDIAPAYPDAAVDSYRRVAALEKGRGITVTDRYSGTRLPAVLSLMTYEVPRWEAAKCTLYVGELGTCRIEGAASVQTEEIPVTDPRLAIAWEHPVYRTLVTLRGGELTLTVE